MNPQSQRRLYKELLDAKLTRHYPTWNEVRDLPYLDACINEAIRLHPPFCLPFERVVPAEGVTVCGHFLPGGTVVGMNPYVVNRHQQTFGVDADAWRPERWLDRGEEERRKLEQSILTVSRSRLFWRILTIHYNHLAVRSRQTHLSRQTYCHIGVEEVDFSTHASLRGRSACRASSDTRLTPL